MVDSSYRRERNEKFLRRLLRRRPEERKRYEPALKPAPEATAMLESAGLDPDSAVERARDMALEAIVNRERPVLFVKDSAFDTEDVTALGNEALDLIRQVRDSSEKILPLLSFIGRFDVTHFPGNDFLGSGWFVDTDIVVTNRHVASLVAAHDGQQFVFRRGVGGRLIEPSLCTAHEYDDLALGTARVFAVKRVLYIEPDSGPNDIAFVQIARQTNGMARPFIPIAPGDLADDEPVCVIGYPARAPRRLIPDQALMEQLYRGRFDVKRAAPGYGMGTRNGFSEHDCTTLGGNSGSVVLDYKGQAVGLHFAGLYLEANYAVPASVLNQYISGKRWNQPVVIETRPRASALPSTQQPTPSAAAVSAVQAGGDIVLTIPLTVRVGLGVPTVVGSGSATPSGSSGGDAGVAVVERAIQAFWDAKPQGVIAVRVGYFEDGEGIGDKPCIAASVRPADLVAVEAAATKEFEGVPVRYLPAEVSEQLEALPSLESVDSIQYDDNARTSPEFALEPVEEQMEVLLHVGPEYSWDMLKSFLNDPQESAASKNGVLTSAMYEFHAAHIKAALEKRLKAGGSLRLVLDNATFSRSEPGNGEFDRDEVFALWEQQFSGRFDRIVAPEGKLGLISDSYHIKVTVREDNKLWLSSGNWKAGSSQPVITQEERDDF